MRRQQKRQARKSPLKTGPLFVLVSAGLVGGALMANPVRASADVTAVKGSAVGYFSKVSLFGGPANLRGFSQQVCTAGAPPTGVPTGCVDAAAAPSAASPSVDLPPTGGNLSQAAPGGAKAQYGPATIFGGIQDPKNDVPPPSGPITVATKGTTGASGAVTSSVDIVLRNGGTNRNDPGGVGPNTFVADEVHSTCTAKPGGVTASTRIVKGVVATSTDSNGDPKTTASIPDTPPVNYAVTGDINNVGDHFRQVYNEQMMNPDGSITVNAWHEYLLGPTAIGDLIVGQVVCGVSATPSSTASTSPASTAAAPTTTVQAPPGSSGGVPTGAPTSLPRPASAQPARASSASAGSGSGLALIAGIALAVAGVTVAVLLLARRRRRMTP